MSLRFFNAGLSGLVVLSAVVFCPTSVSAQISITLHDRPVVQQREFALGDVADVHAPSQAQQLFLSRIALKPIVSDADSVVITREFLAFRMVFAGWARDQITFAGPERVVVQLRQPLPLSDQEIEEAATRTMQHVLGVDRADVRVHLRTAFVNTLPPSLRKTPGLTVQVAAPQRTLLGQTTMDVSIWEDGQRHLVRTARFDVMRRHRVAVARLSMPRDAKLTPTAFHFENRFLSEPMDEPTEEDILGMKVLRQLQTGEIIQMKHLKKDRPATDRGVVVRRGEKVQATAINGPLHVRLSGAVAQEDGRMGEFITLTNGDKQFSAQVVAAGRVEVRLR
ncbi:MAG: hypothetical protein Fues2KO_09890 [Fuerstiella sp.]